EQGSSDCGDLKCAQPHKTDKQLCEPMASLRTAVAETADHPLFESRIRFFLRKSFFQNFVHDFVLLMRFSAGGAFDEMSVKRAAFILQKLAVNICGEPVINFFVNNCHIVTQVKRGRVAVPCAWQRGRGRESRATRRC